MKIRLPLLTLLFAAVLFAQPRGAVNPDWLSFKERVNGYYHNISSEGVDNFSCLITSDSYLNFARANFDTAYAYPLKIIWTRDGRLYYVLQPYPPEISDTLRQNLLTQVQMTRQTFKGFFLDWESLLLTSPLSDIPDNCQLVKTADSLSVTYRSGQGEAAVKVNKLFLPSGKLIRVTVTSQKNVVVNYPLYTEVDGKWLCAGWDSQIYENGEVSSGIACRMELAPIADHYMPLRVDLLMQTRLKPGQKFLTTIFLKDYLFNIPLQELEQPQ